MPASPETQSRPNGSSDTLDDWLDPKSVSAGTATNSGPSGPGCVVQPTPPAGTLPAPSAGTAHSLSLATSKSRTNPRSSHPPGTGSGGAHSSSHVVPSTPP